MRFAEFDSIKEQIELFINPVEIQIESQAAFQLELCDLQSDPFLRSKKNERYEAFWKLVNIEQFPKLGDFALRMLSVFGSIYICESTFSVMKRLKSSTRTDWETKSWTLVCDYQQLILMLTLKDYFNNV